jgi:hypothetical protein
MIVSFFVREGVTKEKVRREKNDSLTSVSHRVEVVSFASVMIVVVGLFWLFYGPIERKEKMKN